MLASNKSPVKWQQCRQLAQEKVKREREKGGDRECIRRGDEIEREMYDDNGGPRRGKGQVRGGQIEGETGRQGEGDEARGGLLPHTSRFVSPERKFSTNALCTLGLRRIGRAIPTTVPVYRCVGCVADYVRKGVARPFISRK